MTRLRVHIFLAGLESEFNLARSEILRKDPPMSLESSYAYIRRDSSQRQTMEEPKVEPDSMVHMVSRNGPQKGKKSTGKKNSFTCTHCGEEGHSKQRCYEIIGYPEWWDFTKKPRKKLSHATVATSAQETPMAAHTSKTDSEFEVQTCDQNTEHQVESDHQNTEYQDESNPEEELETSSDDDNTIHGLDQTNNLTNNEGVMSDVVQENEPPAQEQHEENEPQAQEHVAEPRFPNGSGLLGFI
ncbi:hypothetical protein CTI12_AA220330 [Artemisia annua]|uniref:CCHC-type domain-containing protein n=1 Tax=Artemisia annua TaxID=35608 RepID=A0A2U1MYC9_ARTAN|nr:hypothetical protein CTI12_AA220330 [Artemisia annua]